jgi:predicted DNA-binding transcriptional regulator AlpA
MPIPQTPQTIKEIDPLLNEHEAAAPLGVSVRTLQNWRLRGGGPPYQKLGSAVRYSTSKLHEWIECRSRMNTSDLGSSEPGPLDAGAH